MLDTAGKLLERLIRARLTTAIKAAGDLHEKQYGFRSGRSTVDAIREVCEAVKRAEDHNHFSRRVVLLVTLDVRNAFNSVRWSDMLEALDRDFRVPKYLLRMVDDYLRDRALLYETQEGQRRMAVTSGAAQGSVLGPDLWNVSYDSLLRLEMPEESCLVGYADDVAALVAARTVDQAQIKLNRVMRLVNNWMESHGLTLALGKTEVVVLTKKRIPTVIPVRVGDEVVESKAAVKYLGVMIDSKMTFFEQIKRTADKAAKGVMSLSRLMANIGGPRSSRRRLLMAAVQSVLLYGSEVWADSLNRKTYRKKLGQIQKRSALRVASAYRTVSEPAVLVVAGVMPIDLLAKERKIAYQRKMEIGGETARREARNQMMESWQRAWEQEERGRWTRRLIKQVQPWMERKHGEIDYYLTQFLTGHGYFRSYLGKIGKTETQECLYCLGVADDANHTFFACDRWEQCRKSLQEDIGQLISPDNIVEAMLRGEDTWNRVTRFAEEILRTKKIDLDK